MRKNHFIVVVAHSVHGRIRRVHIPRYAIHLGLAAVLLATIATIGLVSSYTRMAVKAFEFNELRAEKEALQRTYDALAQRSEERDVQLESLGSLASEVSMAFGIKRQTDEAGDAGFGLSFDQSYSRSRSQYDFLQQVQVSTGGSGSVWKWLENTTPSIWPVEGRLSSSFGKRNDPFAGTGSFHAGVDLTARHGTPIVAAAGRGGNAKRLVRKIRQASRVGPWRQRAVHALRPYERILCASRPGRSEGRSCRSCRAHRKNHLAAFALRSPLFRDAGESLQIPPPPNQPARGLPCRRLAFESSRRQLMFRAGAPIVVFPSLGFSNRLHTKGFFGYRERSGLFLNALLRCTRRCLRSAVRSQFALGIFEAR